MSEHSPFQGDRWNDNEPPKEIAEAIAQYLRAAVEFVIHSGIDPLDILQMFIARATGSDQLLFETFRTLMQKKRDNPILVKKLSELLELIAKDGRSVMATLERSEAGVTRTLSTSELVRVSGDRLRAILAKIGLDRGYYYTTKNDSPTLSP